jgi:hypothetical protein
MNSIIVTVVVGAFLCAVQFVFALPWLAVLDLSAFKTYARRPVAWLAAAVGVLAGGVLWALLVNVVQDAERLAFWGKIYGAVLNAQLGLDVLIGIFPLLLLFWPQGTTVALAAFREGVRQPLFWLILAIALLLMLLSPLLPYFTMGDDYKMLRELGHEIIMLAAVLFSVLAASMSISEEIEGRTAITLMSKPVSRRQFLLGKFLGILFAAMLMTGLLGVVFNGVMWFKFWYENEPLPDPAWLAHARDALLWMGDPAVNFPLGAGAWFTFFSVSLPGLIFGFCQVMVLLAIAVALATRLPMVVNLVTCLAVFFLGHLTHILVQASSYGRFKLVSFMARFFENVLPGLDYFDVGPIIARDVPPDAASFFRYAGSIVLYAVLYSTIALLLGLVLFEDRDLA